MYAFIFFLGDEGSNLSISFELNVFTINYLPLQMSQRERSVDLNIVQSDTELYVTVIRSIHISFIVSTIIMISLFIPMMMMTMMTMMVLKSRGLYCLLQSSSSTRPHRSSVPACCR